MTTLDSNQVCEKKNRHKKTVALHYRFFYFMDANGYFMATNIATAANLARVLRNLRSVN